MSTGRLGLPEKLRYLPLLACLTLTGCLSTPPVTDGQTGAQLSPVSDRRAAVVTNASRMIGTPYRYGGNNPGGFDCSGLVQYAHDRAGLVVPRTTREQWRHASRVGRQQLLPGDLVFFDVGREKTSHVGIYEGAGIFIHAPSAGKRVSRASLDNPYWNSRLVGARSFL
jgi:cell wall-associated NlpC family hydrolase